MPEPVVTELFFPFYNKRVTAEQWIEEGNSQSSTAKLNPLRLLSSLGAEIFSVMR